MLFDYYFRCTFSDCDKTVVNTAIEMCPECVHKVINFEEELDDWLEINYPNFVLDDIIGWYCKCSSPTCKRECLEETPFIQGCSCCPCNLKLDYITDRIGNMPTAKWMENLSSLYLEN